MELYSCSIPLATLFVDAMRQGRSSSAGFTVGDGDLRQCSLIARAFLFWEIAEITAMQIRRGHNPFLGHLI